jgi:hypothetical protein
MSNSPSISYVISLHHQLRPRTFAIAVECSATQGDAKQGSYIFVYSGPSHVRLHAERRIAYQGTHAICIPRARTVCE